MKLLFICLCLALVGCQSATPPVALPVAPKALPPPRPPVVAPLPPPPSPVGLEQKVRQQAQYIEALLSQNEALTATLAASKGALPPAFTGSAAVSTPMPESKPAPVAVIATVVPPLEPTLTPNADGAIDLAAAVVTAKPGEPVNPFTVRTVPPEATREVAVRVGGIIAGPTPCAVVNDRLVQVGEAVESLVIERIEENAVWLRHSGRLLQIPVSEKSTRVRLPL